MKKSTKPMPKKAVKPELIINCIDCVTPEDIQDAYIEAKVNAGRNISAEELQFVKDYAAPIIDVYNICEIQLCEKKLPWYKRFWNWLRRK